MAAGREVRRFNRPETARFFMVVRNHLDEGMEIPARFVRKYPDLLDDESVMLRVPGAEVYWRIELASVDGRPWLLRGLREFADFYGINLNYFLFFQCVGNAQFRVTIFDRTRTEINYRIGRDRLYKPTNRPQFYHVVGNSIDQGLRIPSTFVRKHAKKLDDEMTLVDPFESAPWSVHLDVDDNGDVWVLAGLPEFRQFYSIQELDVLVFKLVGNFTFQVIMFHEYSATEFNYRIRPESVSDRANAFRSEHPFFLSTMTEASIRTYVGIPVKFVREHLSGREGRHESMMLRLPPPARSDCRVNVTFTGRQAKIRSSWNSFARLNRLEAGNICAFEWHPEDQSLSAFLNGG